MRYFSLPEIRYHAENNGFELIVALEFLTKREPLKNLGCLFYIEEKVNMDRKFIPVCEPMLSGNENKYVLEALQTGWIFLW